MKARKGMKAWGNVKREKKICLSKFEREQKDWSAQWNLDGLKEGC